MYNLNGSSSRRFDLMIWHSLSKRALYLAVLLLVLALPALAQVQSGNIYGKTAGPEGQPMPGVTVTLTGAGAPQTQTTDERGQFRFPGLSPGLYTVKSELEGFAPTENKNVEVNVGRNTEVDLTLKISEEMTV